MSAGQSSSKAKSKNSNQYSFNQNIPGFQANALNQLYGKASDFYDRNISQIEGAEPGVQNFIGQTQQAALPAWQQNLQGGAFQNVNDRDLLSSINSSLAKPSNTATIYGDIMGGSGNNYADAMRAQYLGDANRATSNMLANLDARAQAAGMSGGARHGVATGQGLFDINSNLQKNLAETGFSTFDKDLQNKLAIAEQADQNTLARQQMLATMLGQKQGAINTGIESGQNLQNLGMGTFAPIMMPWEALSNYASVIGPPTVLSSGQGSGSGKSKAFGQSSSGGLT